MTSTDTALVKKKTKSSAPRKRTGCQTCRLVNMFKLGIHTTNIVVANGGSNAMRRGQLVRNVFKLDGNAMATHQVSGSTISQTVEVFHLYHLRHLACPLPAILSHSRSREVKGIANYSTTSAYKAPPTSQDSSHQTFGPRSCFKRVTKTQLCDKHSLR